ncbi:AP-3 complex subunit delta [Malania oleifera]|uniref:AP-3 complex subunit delta n=1 Tax=Malania oleifera TaxID=397392 RepID=UPI0025AE88A1|nr:AP-3 complex subunit delta [Malania oleifera]XP_057952331.1 AP-3 complex subunit delta [Malania oleifera]
MAGSSIMESLFQRTLEDLIKGLRLQLLGESTFLSKAMEEIRREIKSTDPHTKAVALQKLTYLHSLHGFDMSWAAFHVVEVVSFPSFAHKKIGYLAASLSFHDGTDVILLITNQLRKDLTSTNQFEVSLALEFLSSASNTDLARDLTQEVFTLLSSAKVFVRKKAIGAMLRIFSKYPDAVRVCFKRLVENLESSDPSAVSAAVGVFCELAAKDPNSYLPLAPEFYRVLADSKNNWVLIKVIKIFAKLVPLEPRLAKRVVEPICDHTRRTGAKSLMFECIWTIVNSLSEYEAAVKLSALKIRELLVDDDPNLKYLGLQALSALGPKHLWAVLENKEVVIKYLSDADPNIKLESLRLVMTMVSENNVVEISRVLVNYALKSDPQFCNEILGSILSTSCRNFYEIIVDFDWYVSLLGEMSRIPHCQKGEEIENQLIDIGMRVKDVRTELVRVCRDLLIDPALLSNPFLHRILTAAAWVSGEYVELSKNPFELVEALLQPRTSLLPPLIRAIYIQSTFKVLIFCLHSYILGREIIASASSPSDNLASGVSEGSDLICEAPADSIQDGGLRNQSFEDLSVESAVDVLVPHGQTMNSFSPKKVCFSHESIVNMVSLIEVALVPLSGTNEVEILERTRNVLGLIQLIKQEIPCLIQTDGDFEKEKLKGSKIIKLAYDAFTTELGPVPLSAQERVLIPDGLILKENLFDLEAICGDVHLPSSSSFSLTGSYSGERIGTLPLDIQSKEESEPSTESTSLLAQHRKRHGLYYLPSERNEVVSNDYPPINDPKLHENLSDDAEHLVKLTENSLFQKKKSNQAKPRPVVVKLDEGDGVIVAAKNPESKDNILSGAVRDVLVGKEAVGTSSRSYPLDQSSSTRRGKGKVNTVVPPESKQNLGDADKFGLENRSLARKKHHVVKERRHKTERKNDEEGEESGQKGKQKRSLTRGRRKAQQRVDGPLNVGSETIAIPDFLL